MARPFRLDGWPTDTRVPRAALRNTTQVHWRKCAFDATQSLQMASQLDWVAVKMRRTGRAWSDVFLPVFSTPPKFT